MNGLNNGRIVEVIQQDGAFAACEKGLVSEDEFDWAQRFENELEATKTKFVAELRDLRKQSRRRAKLDLPRGSYVRFDCERTGESYRIYSEQGSASEDELAKDDRGVGYVDLDRRDRVVRRKHYYFYSKEPGFGKSTLVRRLLRQTNARPLLNRADELQVSKHAQFLVIDDFGPTRRLEMSTLKCLTSGLAFVCEGNVQPREDAQLILFGDRHLFEAMGDEDGKTKKEDAALLMQRFFVRRLDRKNEETEESDRLKHVSA